MHKEYKNIIEGADTAVLFIHGILGTPKHFKDFITLVPKEYSIHNLLLDGHGGGVSDFSHTSMRIWKSQVEAAVNDLLKTHKQIVIVAHSMGTLFALQQAYIKPEKIKGLFLLATPLIIRIRFKMFSNSMKLYFNKIKPGDKEAIAYKASCGVRQDKKFWLYFGWIPRFLELFKEIKITRNIINCISVPCRVFLSKKDEMVSLKSIELLKSNSAMQCTILQKSSHHYYFDDDYNILLQEFNLIFKNPFI